LLYGKCGFKPTGLKDNPSPPVAELPLHKGAFLCVAADTPHEILIAAGIQWRKMLKNAMKTGGNMLKHY